ncbi:MAG: hypothetical protein B6I20_03430 [Bacteroidetes bacterium 4572_117]|nr:MAG: hypothetical protein B6I20_03430 [Bacteroidetes bacterium 4572_117]
MKKILLFSLSFWLAMGAFAQNEHWTRQFKKPISTTEMSAITGMSDGVGSPTISQMKWHDGKLWFSGAWEPGVSGADPSQSKLNEYWHLWTWSPVDGYEAVVYYHTAQGGVGPMGVINDFLWLPDGKLVVAGEFTRIDNPGGTRYREVQALAIYDASETTANKWQPLGTFQYNGAVSSGGSIYKLAYDSQGNDLYMSGTFSGIPSTLSFQIHKYNLDNQTYEPLERGVYGTNPKFVKNMIIDKTTTPSTLYIGGSFKWVGGDGDEQAGGGTALYTDAVASYQDGRDAGFGWRSYGTTLKNAADFMFNTSATVQDLAIIDGELWIVGAFKHETDANIAGVAKWDPAAASGAGDWVDPTGKGGVGRDIFSVEQAANGKVYFAGAFGGRNGTSTFYNGFANGDEANMAMSYDPATGTWAELGNGLSGNVMPECHLTTHGNDVYFAGDFEYFDPTYFNTNQNADFESYYVARWNENLDFSTAPIISGTKGAGSLTINVIGGTGTWTYSLNGATAQSNNAFSGLATGLHYVAVTNGTYTDTIWAEFKAPLPAEVAIGGSNNIHWSRAFQDPIEHNAGVMDATTGMKGSLTRSTGAEWHDGKLYFTGHLDSWYVWCYDPASGYSEIANTFTGPPEGLAWHNDKLYVWGALGTAWKSIAVYDPATTTWSTFNGTYNGTPVFGTGTSDGSSGIVSDLTWDAAGNMYFVGNWAFDNSIFPGNAASAVKVTPAGVYETLGTFISEYTAGHPKGIFTILLDETKSPMDMYIGGTFKYARGGTQVENETYNVAKWDPSLNSGNGDWGKMGSNTDGDAGLPPISFIGFFMNGGDAKVTDMVIDTNGDIYASGSIAIYDDNPVIADRDEHFGLVKYDASENKWIGASNAGGVTRDIAQMSWLDANTLLLSGSFNHAENFTHLGNVAKLNTTTGEFISLGGGLVREGMDQTIGAEVVHAIKGNEIYFFGFFDHAGVNANSHLDAPNSSTYIAMWDGTKNLDPNDGLKTESEINVCVTSQYSGSNVSVTFEASGAAAGSTYKWFKWSSTKFVEVGTGSPYTESIYGKAGDEVMRYVAVENADGVLGGKLPVKVKYLYKDDFNAIVPEIVLDATANELICNTVSLSYEWYQNTTVLSDVTRIITPPGDGDYTAKIVSGSCTSLASNVISIASANNAPTVANEIADVTIDEGFGTSAVDISTTFADADGDALTYTVASSNAAVVTAAIAGTTLTLTEVGNGTSNVTVTADDGNGGTVDDIFVVTVSAAANNAPVADAGADQSVSAGATVTLDGSASTDDDGDALTYAWTAPAGITLSSTDVVSPTFTAPSVTSSTDYTISLVVNDGTDDSAADEVVVTVSPVTGIEENGIEDVSIYPNPVSDNCVISFDLQSAEYCEISILNIAGKEIDKVLDGKMSGGKHVVNWNAGNVNPGLYFIRIRRDENVATYQIIVK